MAENLVLPPKSQFETLCNEDQGLPPLVDWDRPPIQIPTDRVEPFIEYAEGEGLTREEVWDIFFNIRYISSDETTRVLGLLAERLRSLIGDAPFYFVHCGLKGKSGEWIERRMIEEFGLESIGGKPISADEFLEQFEQGRIAHEDRIVIADDFAISGEQIDASIIERIRKASPELTSRIIVALVASTDSLAQRLNHRKVSDVTLLRGFRVPTTGEINEGGMCLIPGPFSVVDHYVLTFFHHKVSDHFYPRLSRSNAETNEKDGQQHWLVDDMCIAPPYDSQRFSTGHWRERAERIPR